MSFLKKFENFSIFSRENDHLIPFIQIEGCNFFSERGKTNVGNPKEKMLMTSKEENPLEAEADSLQERFGPGYVWLIRGIAVLLLFAAGMKTWQLATVPVLGEGLLHARWFNILVVEFELFWAIWLLWGLLPKQTRWATLGLFSTFATVSLYKALSGEVSCGCFGQAQVNPWWMFGLDIVIVGFVFSFKVFSQAQKSYFSAVPENNRFFHSLCSFTIVAMTFGGLIYLYLSHLQYSRLSELGYVIGNSKVVELTPNEWQGKPFPFKEYCSLNIDMSDSTLFVMFQRKGCLDCELLRQAIIRMTKTNNISLVVLDVSEMSNSKSSHAKSLAKDENVFYGKTNTEYTWLVETPIVLELRNGIVYHVWRKEDFQSIVKTF